MGIKIVDRIGEEKCNNEGISMKIVEYKNANDIIVEFQDEYKAKVHTKYCHFKNGNIKNPYDKSVIFGTGYIGIGKYNHKDYPNIYEKWRNMLRRCYDPYFINKNLAYKDCFVCEEWHNLQNFCKWWEENIYNCNNERMELDKDILFKNNKIYSPQTCLIVPKRINLLFTKSDAIRGKYPIGVDWHNEKFRARCSILNKENNKKSIHLGYYNSIEEAFLSYKSFKEKYIKQIADEYKDIIPTKLYNTLYSYEIEIND